MKTTNENATEWEADLATAEEYWFQLPTSVRDKYTGQVVAAFLARM